MYEHLVIKRLHIIEGMHTQYLFQETEKKYWKCHLKWQKKKKDVSHEKKAS